MHRLLILIPLLALGACAAVRDQAAPPYLVPAGSRLVLHRALTVPGGSAGVRLQGGEVRGGGEINEWHPNCRLELRTLSDAARTIDPDRFEIVRMRREVNVAAAAGPTLQRVSNNGSATFFVFRTLFDLHSDRQPEVGWLDCQHWGDPALGRDLGIGEIRTALGAIMTLELAERR